jgi:hypothetical protein
MPLFAIVMVTIAILASVIFLGYQVKVQLRRRRNLKHWERGEPLEGTGDWDD